MSIKLKLLISISAMVAFSYIILGYMMLSNSYSDNFENLKNKESIISNESAKYVNDYLSSKADIIESIAKQLASVHPMNSKIEIKNMLVAAKDAGGFGSVYAGYAAEGLMLRWSGRNTLAAKDGYDPRARPWYKLAVEMKNSGVTKPYIDSATKKLTISVFAPIVKDNNIIGVVGSDIFLDTIVKTVLNISIEDYGFAYLVDEKGTILIHKDKKKLNKQSTALKSLQGLNKKFGEIEGKLIAFSKIDVANWFLCVELDKDKAFQKIYNSLYTFGISSIIFLVLTLVILYASLNKILSPIQKVQDGIIMFFEYLKGKNDTLNKLDINSQDEFGVMAKEINKGIESLQVAFEEDKAILNEVVVMLGELEKGDLSQRLSVEVSNPTLNKLKNELNKMANNLQKNIFN